MPINVPSVQLQNSEVLEAEVSGPQGANRLFVCTGRAPFFLGANANVNRDVVTFFVGPALARTEFFNAVATASITSFTLSPTGAPGGAPPAGTWSITDCDADYDVSAGQVEVRVEVELQPANANTFLQVTNLAFQVTILAQRTAPPGPGPGPGP